jgi:energy-coupling factor transporter ATP-binding protein EcfA2/energy-coupling factor transporter transmembrane protein EcfT
MTKISRGGVQVTNLTWTPFASPEPLLRNLSVDIQPGKRVLLIGPSGSGKSTFLRALAGVLTETESGELTGNVTIEGAGLLLQDPNDSLVSDSIFREVAFGLENAAVPQAHMTKIVTRGLEAVGLSKPLAHPSTDLSGGEMQRMAFAGVLATNPDVLLLDEPTSMLDSISAAAVRETVSQQVEQTGSTLIVVEHEFIDWLPLVERVLVLNDRGELIFDGEPRNILSEHSDELQNLGLWLPGLETPDVPKVDLGVGSGGRITVLTGASGAGKTTELKLRLRADVNNKTFLTGVGYLPQQAELTILGNTVFETAHMTAALAAKGLGIAEGQAESNTRKLLNELGIWHLEGRNPYEISGGEQRRLALATALAHAPASVYLDEPSIGQDRQAWSLIVLAARTAGTKLTIATHDTRLIAIADEVIEIKPQAIEPVSDKKISVSGIIILAAPVLLLLGSMRITSLAAGVISFAGLAIATLLLTAAGFRINSAKSLLPGLIAVLSIGLSNWYLSEQQNPQTGLVAGLRVASFVLPGIALAAQLRPIQLGDQLAQWLKLPARPVIAAVAAMQRLQNLIATWDELRFIHRIRGVDLGRGPLVKLGEWSRLVFGLLVQAIRSAGTTAVAMDARGFSRAQMRNRTWAAKPSWGRLDWLVLLIAFLLAAAPFFTN